MVDTLLSHMKQHSCTIGVIYFDGVSVQMFGFHIVVVYRADSQLLVTSMGMSDVASRI